jgi:hypothetical protein
VKILNAVLLVLAVGVSHQLEPRLGPTNLVLSLFPFLFRLFILCCLSTIARFPLVATPSRHGKRKTEIMSSVQKGAMIYVLVKWFGASLNGLMVCCFQPYKSKYVYFFWCGVYYM